MSDPSELTDRDFTHAVVIGIAVGIPALSVGSFLVFKAVSPATSTAALAWLAVWTGLWAGVFVGGTIGVWNHVRRLEH